MINLNKTVGELAVELPCATRVFERFGIDYCCGGKRSLNEACASIGVAVVEVTKTLEELQDRQTLAGFIDWSTRSLTDLCDFIEDVHHSFTRQELDRINRLLEKVINAHGSRHSELIQLHYVFDQLSADLTPHLYKEEEVLFPYIRMIESLLAQRDTLPQPGFITVKNPVQVMMTEHDIAGELLAEIRAISEDFNPPADACNSYRALYQALYELEQDLHKHIHLENNVLFPRAVELETQLHR